MKKCARCHAVKDEKEFINERGGITKQCKMCREYDKEYRERNKEQKKEYGKEYYERNKEQKKEYYERNKEQIKEYRERNKEQIKEYGKEYYERNKEQIKEHMKEYYERNKEQIKECRERNKEQIKEHMKEYYERNKEQIKEHMKEYYERNKGQKKEYMKEYKDRPAKYRIYAHKLTVEESPRNGKRGELLVRCTKCDKYFTPTNREVQNRISSLEGRTSGECRFYCSQECKDSCEIYGVNYDPYAKHSSVERDPQWSKEIKKRAHYACERCGSKENLEAHHEIPVKVNPELVSDEDNGLCLCHDCHMKAHAEEGCTLSDLRKL